MASPLRCCAPGGIRCSILLVWGWRVWHNKLYAMQSHRRNHALDAFCIISTSAMLGQKLRERFDGLVDHLFLNLTYEPAAKKIDWLRLIQELAA